MITSSAWNGSLSAAGTNSCTAFRTSIAATTRRSHGVRTTSLPTSESSSKDIREHCLLTCSVSSIYGQEVADSKSLTTSRAAALTWLGIVALVGLVAITLRTASMNDSAPDDGDPVVPFAILFVVATLIPLFGVRASKPWSKLAAIQCGVVLAAIVTLFAMTPSGDGFYMLPIAMASIATAAIAAIQTLKVRRGTALAPLRQGSPLDPGRGRDASADA